MTLDLELARETLTALADELEQHATESEAEAADARRRAAAVRGVIETLTPDTEDASPFGTRIAKEQP